MFILSIKSLFQLYLLETLWSNSFCDWAFWIVKFLFKYVIVIVLFHTLKKQKKEPTTSKSV